MTSVVKFPVAEIFGVGCLATRLKALESVNQIGPWHIGHWVDYTHTAIRIKFHCHADGKMAKSACGGA